MKTEKKQYRLKKWYPSLPKWVGIGDVARYIKEHECYFIGICYSIEEIEVENNPDFWELIEEEKPKPLFITDDDIEIFDDTTEIISVSIKHHTVSKWGYRYLCKPLDCENFKHFGIEANADKYIEDNKPKPLFITDDGVEVFDDDPYIILKRNYEKVETVAHKNGDYRNGIIRFKHEANADEYIWRNKPVFSYHEIWKYAPYGSPLSIFEQLAKERSEE